RRFAGNQGVPQQVRRRSPDRDTGAGAGADAKGCRELEAIYRSREDRAARLISAATIGRALSGSDRRRARVRTCQHGAATTTAPRLFYSTGGKEFHSTGGK